MSASTHTPPEVHAHLWHHRDGRRSDAGAMIRKGGGFIFIPHHQLIATATALADIYEAQENR